MDQNHMLTVGPSSSGASTHVQWSLELRQRWRIVATKSPNQRSTMGWGTQS